MRVYWYYIYPYGDSEARDFRCLPNSEKFGVRKMTLLRIGEGIFIELIAFTPGIQVRRISKWVTAYAVAGFGVFNNKTKSGISRKLSQGHMEWVVGQPSSESANGVYGKGAYLFHEFLCDHVMTRSVSPQNL